MDLTNVSSDTKLWFNTYVEAMTLNANLPKGIEKMDRQQIQTVTTAIFIQKNMNGGGYTPGKTKSGKQTEETWDGTESIPFGEHKGKAYKDVPMDRLEFYADGNDPKYPNKAQWEIDRRSSEDVDEPPPEDFSPDLTADDNLPF